MGVGVGAAVIGAVSFWVIVAFNMGVWVGSVKLAGWVTSVDNFVLPGEVGSIVASGLSDPVAVVVTARLLSVYLHKI